MAFDQAQQNVYNFSEVTLSDKQPLVTNGLGRTVLPFEIVFLGGYLGEVRDYDGIVDSAQGRINIDPDRTVRTEQIEVTDTFVVGQVCYFLSGGSSAAGEIRATPEAGSVPAGIVLEEEGTGGAQTSVTFSPFAQGGEAALGQGLKVMEIVVPTGSAAAPVVNTDIPVGSKIIDVTALGTAASGSGTVTVSDGTNDITVTAVVMAVIDALSRAVDIDATYRTVVAAGLTLTANADADAGIVHVYYI